MATHQAPKKTGYMSLKQAAAYVSMGERTLRRFIAEGTLKAYRVGGRQTIRIKLEDLEAMFTPTNSWKVS